MTWDLWLGIGLGIGTDFQVIRDGDRVDVRGPFARAKAAEIRSTLSEIGGPDRFALAGSIGPGRRIRLRWSRGVDAITRQRARNVLVDLLG